MTTTTPTTPTSYEAAWSFYKALDALVEAGITLEGLYREQLKVADPDLRKVDASPAVLRQLASRWTQGPVFIPIRLNEIFGGLQVEHSDDYVLAMVAGLAGRHQRSLRTFMLRTDHELREDVFWRVFEVEGGGEISLTNVDKFSGEGCSWFDTVMTLAEDGTLDRERLLRSSLEALNRDFSSYRAGWFSRLYAQLAPTPTESAADQDLLRLSLASSVTATVSLAVKQLALVHTAGLLDAAAFAEACAPALTGPKGAAVIALRVLAQLAAESAEVSPDAVAEIVTVATGHPHADVQRLAITTLLTLHRADLAHQFRGALAPAVASALLPAATPRAEPDAPGIAATESAPAIEYSRPEAEPVHPWGAHDALERYAALLEDESDVVEFELALAWLASAPAPGDVLAPLEKRATKRQEADTSYASSLLLTAVNPTTEFLPQKFWRRTTMTMADDAVTIEHGAYEPFPSEEEASPLPAAVTRLREVASILAGQTDRRVLLATPTDTHGWVDPAVFMQRHQDLLDASVTPQPADLTQALLRLPSSARPGVLAALGVTEPDITSRMSIVWTSRASDVTKASGAPLCVWWTPAVVGATDPTSSAHSPAVIPSAPEVAYYVGETLPGLMTGLLAFAHPSSTLPLVAASLLPLNWSTQESAPVGEEAVLDTLAWHPGAWTAQTGQIVALGMAAKRAEIRAQAAELLAAVLPERLTTADAAAAFAACAPAIVLTRWAQSFADAATLSPGPVRDLLTALVPRLDRQTRGIGALLTVLLDESVRHGSPTTDPTLRTWLGTLTGSSAAAKAARSLLALGV